MTEYENEILWFEQTLKPTERPKLVARLFAALSGPAKEATQSQSTETFAVEDAEQDLKFLKKKVGILAIPDLGHKLDDCFFRPKRVMGETLAEWSFGKMVCPSACSLHCNERLEGKTRAVHDSSAQTKPDEQAEEFEVIDDVKDTPSVGTARSRPWSIQGKSVQCVRTAMSRRILE